MQNFFLPYGSIFFPVWKCLSLNFDKTKRLHCLIDGVEMAKTFQYGMAKEFNICKLDFFTILSFAIIYNIFLKGFHPIVRISACGAKIMTIGNSQQTNIINLSV